MTLKVIAIKPSGRTVAIYKPIRRYIPEEFNCQQNRCENLEFIIINIPVFLFQQQKVHMFGKQPTISIEYPLIFIKVSWAYFPETKVLTCV
jgi:hypothetical protein